MALGWLFGKKKVLPKVPLPEGRPFDEKTFQFSKRFSGETLIEPENLQAAAGFDQPLNFPEETAPQKPAVPKPLVPSPYLAREPVYIKVDVYQRVLGEMDELKSELNRLGEITRKLESSEYNEEGNFDKLKKTMKMSHDKLLQIDSALFKNQGE